MRNKSSNDKQKISTEKVTGWKRIFWIVTGIFSFVWIFIPEITDVVPVIGWLDEGIAVILFFSSLSELGINIPVISKIVNFFYNRKKGKIKQKQT
ncbi:MAG: hypothetical protein OEZ34_01620 [Spirochaetia bacterium]|nr:hypothetical protein [Spirochaetia bacterium]